MTSLIDPVRSPSDVPVRTDQVGREGVVALLLSVARSASTIIDRYASPFYCLILLGYVALFAMAAAFFTVEADEAWILFSTANAFGLEVPDTSALDNPTVTSGGLHTLIHGLVAHATDSIHIHRAMSLLFSAALLRVVFVYLRDLPASRAEALAGTALFAAAPGFFLQAGLATAEIMATTVLLLACIHWVRSGSRSPSAAVVSGILLGLSCATRINCVVALPAFALYALLNGADWKGRLLPSAVCIGIASAILTAALAAYILAAGIDSWAEFRTYLAGSTGVGGSGKGVVEIVRYLVVGFDFIPLAVMAAIVGTFVVLAARGWQATSRDLCALLLLIGLAGWLVWAWKAPIPHLRYLWPPIPFIWLVGTILVVTLLHRARDAYARLAVHCMIVAVCTFTALASLLFVANGESLTVVYQMNRTTPFQLPGRKLEALTEQRRAAAFIAGLPAAARLYTFTEPAAYPITYLSGRTIDGINDAGSFDDGESYLVAIPADVGIWRPSPEFLAWRARYGVSVFKADGFELFRIRNDATLPHSNRWPDRQD